MQNWCSFEYSQLKVLFYFAFCSALWDLFYSSSPSSLFPSQNNRDNLICCCCLNVLLLFCCCVACSCIRLCIENDCPNMWFCFFVDITWIYVSLKILFKIVLKCDVPICHFFFFNSINAHHTTRGMKEKNYSEAENKNWTSK